MKKNKIIISLIMLFLVVFVIGMSGQGYASDHDEDDDDDHKSYYFDADNDDDYDDDDYDDDDYDDDDYDDDDENHEDENHEDNDDKTFQNLNQTDLEEMRVEYKINELTQVNVEADFQLDDSILDKIEELATFISNKEGELEVESKFRLEDGQIENTVRLKGNLTSSEQNLLDDIKEDIIRAIDKSGLNKAEVKVKIELELDDSVDDNNFNDNNENLDEIILPIEIDNNVTNVTSRVSDVNLTKFQDEVSKIEEQLNLLENNLDNNTQNDTQNTKNEEVTVNVDKSFLELIISIFNNLFN